MAKERDFQRDFGKWARANLKPSAAFELKLSRDSYISFSVVKEHQILGLLNVKNSSFHIKLPDLGFQNPFDSLLLGGIGAFVVIKYPSGEFYGIDIERFIKEKDESTKKSLTENRAKEIAAFVGR